MTSEFKPTYITVHNEDADLRVWHQGSGALLVLIQGGGGDGARFNAALPLLSQHYTIATYDRRGNAGSTVSEGRPLNPVESARDVVSIIKALGFKRASVFGTSSGGLIAMQLAASYPEWVEHAVIHEAPTLSLVTGETTDRIDNAFQAYQTWREYGTEAGLKHFQSSGAGHPTAPSRDEAQSLRGTLESQSPRPPHRLDYFFEWEFIVLNIYTPSLAQIRAHGVSIATVEGQESGEKFYAKAARAQSEILACRHFVWPGGHAPFMTDPGEFAKSLKQTLEVLARADRHSSLQ